MRYTIDHSEPQKHYLNISLETETKGENCLQFQLPAWRPGRYELGNFAKNIQQWNAFNEKGEVLPFQKLTKDLWEVGCEGAEKVVVKYNYFAFELNAGSTFFDSSQLYVNPVNCFLYLPTRMEEACELSLNIPENYQIAIGLNVNNEGNYMAKNFDELADSPFIASADLQELNYVIGKTTFHLWFQGELKLDESLLLNDFKAFSEAQIEFFGEFPTEEYHFLFQIVPYAAYHGVEHSNNTVILLGPSYAVLDKSGRYEDLLGVSSHELFHTWNVKRIRPIEMWPYEFSKENYSKLGYLSEGATTWYGDVMLLRSNVFDEAAFFRTFNQLLDRHFNNQGIKNLSVADSSFDTWLDGYTLGVPNRKSSIYTEGALITFVLDSLIRRNTNHEHSFDDVMYSFYWNYYKKDQGVSESDYKKEVERFAKADMTEFFRRYINGVEDLEEELNKALGFFGLQYEKQASAEFYESYLGIKLDENQAVAIIYPRSPAELAGLSLKDKIKSVNGFRVNNDLSKWLHYFREDKIELSVFDGLGQERVIKVELGQTLFFANYKVSKEEALTEGQKEAFAHLSKSTEQK